MLLGEAPPELPPLVASEVEAETVWLVAKEQSKYWKNINAKACQPKEGHTISLPLNSPTLILLFRF
jgi:histone deacetylase 6